MKPSTPTSSCALFTDPHLSFRHLPQALPYERGICQISENTTVRKRPSGNRNTFKLLFLILRGLQNLSLWLFHLAECLRTVVSLPHRATPLGAINQSVNDTL